MYECMRSREAGEPPYLGYTAKVDVYSLGIVFFWLVAGVPPFNKAEVNDDLMLAKQVLRGKFRIPNGVQLSKEGLKLILACCYADD